MKKIINKYIKIINELIKDKFFVICLILTTLLSYGFMLANFSVGVDDLALDRYVDGTYILSAGRWGTWLIYRILNINTFTPFWLEFMCLIVLLVTCLILCAFLKEVTNSKLNRFSYFVFALSYISYPVVCNFLVYQPTNFTVCISNFILIFMVILLYERYIQKKDIKLNLILLLVLSFGISMYEACCQTFVVLVFLTILFYNKFNKELSFKDNIKFCFKCFLFLLVGIIINYVISGILISILDKLNLLTTDYASKETIFGLLNENGYTIIDLLNYKFHFIFKKFNFFSIEFLLVSWILLFIFVVESIKNKKNSIYILWYLLAFLSNFILYFLMNACTFRTCYSWMVFIGFALVYVIESLIKYKKLVLLICVWIILMQSRNTNQIFYNDFIGYQRDVNYSNYIINRIIDECSDIKKPLLILDGGKLKNSYLIIDNFNYKYYSDLKITPDIRSDFYSWGLVAFAENGIEIVKFFNHLGYNFEVVDDYDKYYEIYDNLSSSEKNKDIIELDNFIVVKV